MCWAFPVNLNAKRPYRWLVNTSWGNGLLPSDNKPLPKPMLTQIYFVIWRHSATMSTNESISLYDKSIISPFYIFTYAMNKPSLLAIMCGIHRRWLPLTKGQYILMFPLLLAWTNCWLWVTSDTMALMWRQCNGSFNHTPFITLSLIHPQKYGMLSKN